MTEADNSSQVPVASGAIQRVVHTEMLPIPAQGGFGGQPESHKPGALHILWLRKWFVLVGILLAAAGGGAYALLATPIYEASSFVYVTQSGPRIMASDSLDGRQSTNYLNTECRVLMSGTVLGRAKSAVEALRTFAGDTSVLETLAEKLKVAPGRSDDLITVSFESPSQQDAADVVNAVVDAYVAYQNENKKQSAGDVLKILEPEMARTTEQLKTARDALATFKQNHPDLGLQIDRGNIIIQKLDRLSAALTEADLEVMAAKSSCDSILARVGLLKLTVPTPASAPSAPQASTVPPDSNALAAPSELGDPNADQEGIDAALTEYVAAQEYLAIIDGVIVGGVRDPNIDWMRINQYFEAKQLAGVYGSTQDEESILRSELNGLTVQLQSLKLTLSPDNRNITRLEKQIEEVKKQVISRQETMAKGRLSGVREQYVAAFTKRRSVQVAYNAQMTIARKLNTSVAEYARQQNQIDQITKHVEALDARIQDLRRTQNAGALNVSVLQRAQVPTIPVRPKKLQVIGISLAIGVMLGLGLALLRNWADSRVRSAEEVVGLLGVPVIGVLPRIKGRQGLPFLGRNVLDDPMSPAAEAYRGIRTALNYGLQGTHARTVLITSPAPGDGKSSLISNLAITMAQAGQRTLVMDADMLSPQQHVIFGLPNDIGLANVLSGEATLEQAIHRDGDHGPDILPSGRVRLHTSELLHGRPFLEVIRALSETYDQILIDSPPLLSVTDPLVLAAISDVTILVLRAERSDRKMAEQARDGLISVGARVFGAVVNDVKGNATRYGGYYRYQSGRRDYASPDAQAELAGDEKK